MFCCLDLDLGLDRGKHNPDDNIFFSQSQLFTSQEGSRAETKEKSLVVAD